MQEGQIDNQDDYHIQIEFFTKKGFTEAETKEFFSLIIMAENNNYDGIYEKCKLLEGDKKARLNYFMNEYFLGYRAYEAKVRKSEEDLEDAAEIRRGIVKKTEAVRVVGEVESVEETMMFDEGESTQFKCPPENRKLLLAYALQNAAAKEGSSKQEKKERGFKLK